MIAYQDKDLTLYQGDAIKCLGEIEEESVNCVMTSPPYWGLRNYDTDPQDWGDWSGELGLEPTPEMFISHLADVFDAIKRVLRKDGTLWVNLGDSYLGSQGRGRGKGNEHGQKVSQSANAVQYEMTGWMKPKQLALIPSRFAIEMQNRGWILRNDVIWQKPNPMPSSVKDRMTNSYEHLFFFVKNKKYWYDNDAIREPHKNPTEVEYRKKIRAGKQYNAKKPYKSNTPYAVQPRTKDIVEYRDLPDLIEFSTYINGIRKKAELTIDLVEERFGTQAPHHWFNAESYPSANDYKTLKQILNLSDKYDEQMTTIYEKSSEKVNNPEGRNALDVWKIATEPLKDEHYAAYPQKLCERPIKAGCPKDGTVLDPFCGSGTTLLVARRLSRKSIGIDLKYQDIALRRLNVNQQRLNI